MANNKFDRNSKYDFSWQTSIPELPQIDFGMLNETMANVQQGYDQTNLLSEKRPNVLNTQEDMALYQQYKTKVDTGLQEVKDAYSVGIREGQAAQNKLLMDMRKEWTPGGRADALNKRYESYQAAQAELDKQRKDDPRGINTSIAERQLQDQLLSPIGYNPETGQYKGISAVDIARDPDVRKAVDETLKGIEADTDTAFQGLDTRDWWIKKIKTETRTAEKIKLATEALLQMPEYNAQLQRDAVYKSYGTDKDGTTQQVLNSLDKQYQNIESQAEQAKKGDAKSWQQFLQGQGYNVSADGKYGDQTDKATQDYLNKAKQQVEDSKKNFNYDSYLQDSVKQEYVDYALRGAYEKNDTDLVYNKAKEALMDNATKREANRIQAKRLEYEFAPKQGSDVTVVSGVDQKLGDLDKHIQDVKQARDQSKQKLDNTFKNSKAFNGWTVDNALIAQNTWDETPGNSFEEKKANYKQRMNQLGSFQFNDDQINNIVQDLMQPNSESSVRMATQAYVDADMEAKRFEDAQKGVASQYINTPDGQQAIQELRSVAPKEFKNLSDADLMSQALSNPSAFPEQNEYKMVGTANTTVESYNPALKFKGTMNQNIEKQQKAGVKYDWTSLNGYEVYANKSDKYLRPTLDGIAQAIETGNALNFSSEGMAGLTFRDNQGNTIENTSAKKVSSIGVTKDISGKPILKVGLTFTNTDGKTKDGYTQIDLVPGSPESSQILNSLKSEYVNKVDTDPYAAGGILDLIDGVSGQDHKKEAATNAVVQKLNRNNTESKPLFMRSPYGDINMQNQDYRVKVLERDNIAGQDVQVVGVNTPTGNFIGNVKEDINGNLILIPSPTGQTLYANPIHARRERLGMKVKSETPVEVTERK